jgi:hypothetical protein
VYPALHGPVQFSEVNPDVAPNLPATHWPVQLALVIPADDPYRPALQLVQEPTPASEYVPGEHSNVVAFVDPAGQAYPALHPPEQDDVATPDVEPYRPALQLIQDPAPASAYVPAGHRDAVGVVDPAGQAYPAEQLPLQDGVGMPDADPYRPALQLVHDSAPANE